MVVKNQFKRDMFITLLFAVMDVSLIGVFLGSFLRSSKIPLQLIGLLFSIKILARLLSDLPFGIISDLYGCKVSFFISRILRVLSVALLIVTYKTCNLYVAVVSMVFYGASMSGMYGKIEAYLYRYATESKINFYQLLSWYYLLVNISMIACGTISGFLITRISYVGVATITIVTSSLSIPLLYFMPDASPLYKERTNHKFSSLVASLYSNVHNKRIFLIFLLFGITSVFVWRSMPIINIILLQRSASTTCVATVHNAHFIAMIFGSLLSTIVFSRLSLKSFLVPFMTLFGIALFMFSVSLYSANLITYGLLCFIIFLFPTVQSILEFRLVEVSDAGIRSSIMSLGTSVSSILSIIISALFGLLIDTVRINFLLVYIFVPLVLLSVWIIVKLIGYEK